MTTLLVFFLLLGLVALLIGLGFRLARDKLSGDYEELDTQRQMLNAEWTALEQARKVHDVFFAARDAMRRAEHDASERRRP
jgi:hypothetical protein